MFFLFFFFAMALSQEDNAPSHCLMGDLKAHSDEWFAHIIVYMIGNLLSDPRLLDFFQHLSNLSATSPIGVNSSTGEVVVFREVR